MVVYHGSQRAGELKQSILSSARIILTSYGVVAAEFASRRRRCAPCVLFDVQWRRVVLDEAHLIKSHTALSSRAVVALRSSRRWAITGTVCLCRCECLSCARVALVPAWCSARFRAPALCPCVCGPQVTYVSACSHCTTRATTCWHS